VPSLPLGVPLVLIGVPFALGGSTAAIVAPVVVVEKKDPILSIEKRG